MLYLFEMFAFVAGTAVGVVLARRVARGVERTVPPSLEPRRRVIRIARAWAVSIVVVFSLEWWFPTVAGRLGLSPTIDAAGYYQWWRYWPPVAATAVWVIVVAAALARTRPRPEEHVGAGLRRTWRTYLRRSDVRLALAALALLSVTVLVAGLASSSGESGWFTELAIPVGDQGAGFATFPGWGNGVPLLLAAALLAVAALRALSADSIAPFHSPATVGYETALRQAAATSVLAVAAGGILLGLGHLWFAIGVAGVGSVGFGIPHVGMFTFQAGYAAIAPAIAYAGAALEGLGFFLIIRMAFAPVAIS
ncbi:MAG TPA: hypothetical protein VN085_13275, partial [Vicinamibacterales bacterium]|nr:hypothetical protein [Vicinamibacterales bacterium]